jgi:hypothetical protein
VDSSKREGLYFMYFSERSQPEKNQNVKESEKNIIREPPNTGKYKC